MNIYILKIFDIEINDNFFKNRASFLSYYLLSYIYYKIYNKNLDFKNILRNENGKPYLKNNEFYFNISHCKNYICIGISKFEIGVDIEEKRDINKNALNKFLNENEIKNKVLSPLEYWVFKEGYSKYLGYGLKMNFKHIDLNFLKNECLKKELFSYEIINQDFICFCFSKSSFQNIFFIKKNELIEFINKKIKKTNF